MTGLSILVIWLRTMQECREWSNYQYSLVYNLTRSNSVAISTLSISDAINIKHIYVTFPLNQFIQLVNINSVYTCVRHINRRWKCSGMHDRNGHWSHEELPLQKGRKKINKKLKTNFVNTNRSQKVLWRKWSTPKENSEEE